MKLWTGALIIVLALTLLAAFLASEVPEASKMFVIGFLAVVSAQPVDSAYGAALVNGLGSLGFVPGQNVIFENRWAEGRPERLRKLASDLVRRGADVIIAVDTAAAIAAKETTSTIPIVMVKVDAPVEAGLVASLRRPGGNVTGVTWVVSPEIYAKWLQLLKDAVPKLSRAALLLNPTHPDAAAVSQTMSLAALTLGVKLDVIPVRSSDEFKPAFARISRELPDGLVVWPDPLAFDHQVAIVNFAAKHRLAAIYGMHEFAEVGGLLSYGTSFTELFRRAGIYVGRILIGTSPADLPVEQPAKFELVINAKTARALGLTLPPSLLLRADRVIE